MWRLVLVVTVVALELCLQLATFLGEVEPRDHRCDEAAGVCRLEY